MSIFSKIGHAFEHLGDDIKHAAQDVGHGFEKLGKDIKHGVDDIGKDIKQDIEHLDPFAGTKIGEGIEHAFAKIGKGIKDGVEEVGKGLAKDASTVVKDVKKTGSDLAHGHFKQAFHDAVNTGKDAFNGYYDAVTAVGHVAVDSLADMHLGKGMDKAMGKLEKGYNAFTNDIKSSVDQVGSEVVEGTVGAISSTIQAGKDAVHGKWGEALDKLGEAGMDTLSVASDLTPEGAMAAVGTNVLINAHIGNAQLDTVIGGALHGNVAETAKGIAKGVGEMEAGNVAQKALGGVESKFMSAGGGSDSGIVAAGVLGAAAGGAGGFSFGRKGSHESFGGSGGAGGSGKFGKFASFGKLGGGSGGSGGAGLAGHFPTLSKLGQLGKPGGAGDGSGLSGKFGKFASFNKLGSSGLSSHFPTISKLGHSGKFGGKSNAGGHEELQAGHAGAGNNHTDYAAHGAEDEHDKKQQRADNAQNAADNAAANNTASNTAPDGMPPMPFMMPPQAPGTGRSASLVGGDDSSSSSSSNSSASPTSHAKA